MTLDIEDVVTRIGMTLRGFGGAGLPVLCPEALAGVRALAQHAAMVADAYADGALSDDEMARELEAMRHMTRGYAGSLRGLPGSVVEAVARAAQHTLFGALRPSLSFAGAPLPRGLARQDP